MNNYGNARGGYQQRQNTQPASRSVVPLTQDNFADLAENAIKTLSEKTDNRGRKLAMLTTSQIRNLLAMTADIYNEVAANNSEELSPEIIERINYLRIRFAYEAGRDPKVKNFVETANIIEYMKKAKESKTEYIRFSRYMEALVAYHRYYGGKDQ